jgi:hypothetical protein
MMDMGDMMGRCMDAMGSMMGGGMLGSGLMLLALLLVFLFWIIGLTAVGALLVWGVRKLSRGDEFSHR